MEEERVLIRVFDIKPIEDYDDEDDEEQINTYWAERIDNAKKRKKELYDYLNQEHPFSE